MHDLWFSHQPVCVLIHIKTHVLFHPMRNTICDDAPITCINNGVTRNFFAHTEPTYIPTGNVRFVNISVYVGAFVIKIDVVLFNKEQDVLPRIAFVRLIHICFFDEITFHIIFSPYPTIKTLIIILARLLNVTIHEITSILTKQTAFFRFFR